MAEASPVPQNEVTQFAVLLFTDICGSTALKSHHGALEYKTAAELHNRLFEQIAADESLTLIKNTGDGYFARTFSVAAAVRFALRFQSGMRAMPWPVFPLTTRVGIHAGEVADITTLGQADVLAPAADLVARVMSLAVGGQILLTRWPFDEARHFVRRHPAVPHAVEPPALTWLAHGPYLFKGCDDPVEVFEVGADNAAPLAAPPDGEKAKRAIRAGEEQTLGWRPAVGLEVPGRAGWMLGRKIGEGGFGEVWLAEQEKMKQQRVFKFCFDDERLRSFKRELTFFRLLRDVLGERPDIARLYDVKLDEPPFFLESEFADEGNLTEWAAKQGGIAQVPLSRRIELVAQIADAVSAAHSVGVLHKDLKPQNVLMQTGDDGESYPQLTDFGIGTLADKSALEAHAITAAGFTINTIISHGSGSSMTRLYAPPEQYTGRAYTVQGDVYALGVVLFQMVVGDFTHALAPGWEREVKDELLREDIADCVDGDPARRLASTAELSTRLRTLDARRTALAEALEKSRLAEELTAAKARAAVERERSKRARRIATVVGALAVAALGAGVFASWQAVRARSAERLASDRLSDAGAARDAAESLINEAIYGLRKKLLPLGKVELLEEMVAAAAAYYRTLPGALSNDEVQRHIASLALNRALIDGALGHDDEYEKHTREALGIMETLIIKHPADEKLQEESCYAMLNLCYLFSDRSAHEALVATADTTIKRCEAWLKEHPNALWAMRYQALSHGAAAQALIRGFRKPLEGTSRLKILEAIAKRMREIGGETADVCEIEGFIHYGNANIAEKAPGSSNEGRMADFRLAENAFGRALELGGDSALLRETYLGAMHHAGLYQRRWAMESADENGMRNADAVIQKAMEGRRKLVELEPARAEWWRDLAHSYRVLGEFESDPVKSADYHRESLRCRDSAIERQSTRPLLYDERAWTICNFVDALLKVVPVDKAQAVELAARAVEDWAAAARLANFTPPNHPDSNEKIRILAKVCAVDAEASLPTLARARVALESLLGKLPSTSHVEVSYGNLLKLQRDTFGKLGRTDEAAKVSATLAILEETRLRDAPTANNDKAWEAQKNCWKLSDDFYKAPADERAAQFAHMEAYANETNAWLDQRQSFMGKREYALTRSATSGIRGTALNAMQRFAEAETLLRISLKQLEDAATSAPTDGERMLDLWEAAGTEIKLGFAIFKQGREDEGRKMHREAAEAREKIAGESHLVDRWREAGVAWREYAQLLAPEAEADLATAWEHAIALGRKAVEAATADKHSSTETLDQPRGQLAWNYLLAGNFLQRIHRESEAEKDFREGLALAATRTTANTGLGSSNQMLNIRFKLVKLLIQAKRMDEGRVELAAFEADLHAAEAKSGPDTIDREGRAWLEELRSKLSTE